MHTHPALKNIFWLWLAISAAPALAIDITPQHRESGEFGISIGAEYTTGEYGGTESTDIWYYPLTLHYETGRWLWWTTIPYLVVEGPGDVVIIGSGMGSRRTATTTTTRRTESGIGDIIVAASYRMLKQTESRPAFDLSAKVYFGTADETKGLGTGENSYAVQLGLMKDIAAWAWYGTAGYLLTGDPAGVEYEDAVYGILDVAYHFDRHAVGAVLEVQQETLPGSDAPAKLTAYLTAHPGRHTELTGYLLHGFTDASPDWGVGVMFGWKY